MGKYEKLKIYLIYILVNVMQSLSEGKKIFNNIKTSSITYLNNNYDKINFIFDILYFLNAFFLFGI